MPQNVGKVLLIYCENTRVVVLPYISIDCSEYGIFRSIIIANHSFVGSSNVGSGFSKGDMAGIKTRYAMGLNL